MEWPDLPALGWGAAAAALAVASATAAFRRWKAKDERRKERDALLEKYKMAVDGRDLALASALAARLRELGGEPPE